MIHNPQYTTWVHCEEYHQHCVRGDYQDLVIFETFHIFPNFRVFRRCFTRTQSNCCTKRLSTRLRHAVTGKRWAELVKETTVSQDGCLYGWSCCWRNDLRWRLDNHWYGYNITNSLNLNMSFFNSTISTTSNLPLVKISFEIWWTAKLNSREKNNFGHPWNQIPAKFSSLMVFLTSTNVYLVTLFFRKYNLILLVSLLFHFHFMALYFCYCEKFARFYQGMWSNTVYFFYWTCWLNVTWL